MPLAARLAEMPVEEFIALNPGFSRPIIRASDDAAHRAAGGQGRGVPRQPREARRRLARLLEDLSPENGETFEPIAKKFGMSLGQLKEVNGIAPRTRTVPQLLVVPTEAARRRQAQSCRSCTRRRSAKCATCTA